MRVLLASKALVVGAHHDKPACAGGQPRPGPAGGFARSLGGTGPGAGCRASAAARLRDCLHAAGSERALPPLLVPKASPGHSSVPAGRAPHRRRALQPGHGHRLSRRGALRRPSGFLCLAEPAPTLSAAVSLDRALRAGAGGRDRWQRGGGRGAASKGTYAANRGHSPVRRGSAGLRSASESARRESLRGGLRGPVGRGQGCGHPGPRGRRHRWRRRPSTGWNRIGPNRICGV